MIVKAFAEGDQGTLKKLASHEISSEFIKMIKQREKKEQRLEVKIDRILDIDILKADLVNNEAFVTMTITSLQIIALFDKKNKVIEGNAEKSQEVVDRWTFKKDVTKKDPNWLLIETSAAL